MGRTSWSAADVPVGPAFGSRTLPSGSGSGNSPDCQPAFKTPTPGSDVITEPSGLTVADPTVTNEARSWSYEYISGLLLGGKALTFGMVIAAGGLKMVPMG